MSEPSVRASLVKMVLRRATEVWPGDAAAIHAALGPDALARLDATPGYEWVPLTFEVAIVHAVHALHGDEGARRLGREIGLAGPQHPLLRPLVMATLGMLGRRPSALLEVAVSAWRVATRDAGGAALELLDLPEVLRERPFLLRIGGATEALFELAGLRTAVEVEWEEGASSAVLRLSWSSGG